MAGIVEQVDIGTVLLTSCVALVAHMLHASSSTIQRKAVGLMVRESKDAAELRHEMRDLTKEQNGLSVVNDFVKYSRLQRQLNQKQKALDLEESKLRSQRRWLQLMLTVMLLLAEMLLHIVTALSLWGVSLIVLDAEQLWMPLGLLLSLPKGVVGEVSVTVWMLICREILKMLSHFLMY